MRKTLLFTTMALALLLAAGMAWAAPAAPTTVPLDGATNVDPNANITATFAEAMKARSINTNTFYLLQGNFVAQSDTKNPPRRCATPPVPPSTTPVAVACPAAPVDATVSLSADTKTATLNPNSTLLPGTTYTAVVEGTGDGDYVAVKNTGGTPLAHDYIFIFTTAGTGNPGLG